jgi:hypothetical protein
MQNYRGFFMTMENIRHIMAAFMILAAITLGIAILTTDILSDRLDGSKRILFIFLMFGYAAYRGFRFYYAIKHKK